MKKIYVVIKKRFPSEKMMYMVKYLAIYLQRNGIIIIIYYSFTHINSRPNFE